MKFKSSRGGESGVSFADAILRGYARDGGLYMPEKIPKISRQELKDWRQYTYPQVATEIMSKFCGDEIPQAKLSAIMCNIFSQWEDDEKIVVPLKHVNNYYIAELFHGPSWSFKDFGQQMLCRLLDYFSKEKNVPCSLLVSTTGDTGPAAIKAVLGCKRLRIVCTYPKGHISDLQERQIITVSAPNVQAISYQGGGDDMDLPIKNIVTDQQFAKKAGIGSVNSINIGRVTSQVINYVWSYLQLAKKKKVSSEGVIFSIPTGAMGNIAAGFLAYRMGLPVKKFVIGTNDNDISHRVIATGLFHKRELKRTKSEAINIQVPYNFERLLYLFSDANTDKVKDMYCSDEGMEKTGVMEMDRRLMSVIRNKFTSAKCDDEKMIQTIQKYQGKYNYLCDPHTAVAVYAAEKTISRIETAPVIIFSTAHPCKFAEAITDSFGQKFWKDYKVSDKMPKAASALYKQPTARSHKTFIKSNMETLESAQQRWEAALRDLVDADRSFFNFKCFDISSCWSGISQQVCMGWKSLFQSADEYQKELTDMSR